MVVVVVVVMVVKRGGMYCTPLICAVVTAVARLIVKDERAEEGREAEGGCVDFGAADRATRRQACIVSVDYYSIGEIHSSCG
jgi:hypothetical protein